MEKYYEVRQKGKTWSIYKGDTVVLDNLAEWQARAIVVILNGSF
jgi:hypothetical protein